MNNNGRPSPVTSTDAARILDRACSLQASAALTAPVVATPEPTEGFVYLGWVWTEDETPFGLEVAQRLARGAS